MVTLSETAVNQRIMLEAARLGAVLWRNNVGVCIDATGRAIRYGLANESERMNREIKSSDFIGATPMIILPEHVGRIVGVFTMIEGKRSDWTYRQNDDHANAQLRFINHMRSVGAIGGFCNDASQVANLLRF